MRFNKKGQASIEYLMIIGYSFFIITIIMGIYLLNSQEQQKIISGVQISHISDSLISAAEEVYYLGEPAQKTISIQFPEGISVINATNFNSTLGTASLLFYEESKGKTYLFYEGISNVNISVSISNLQGKKDIRVFSKKNYVCIIDKSTIAPVGCS
jgi:uncharacterized protein (UPF0333 family)